MDCNKDIFMLLILRQNFTKVEVLDNVVGRVENPYSMNCLGASVEISQAPDLTRFTNVPNGISRLHSPLVLKFSQVENSKDALVLQANGHWLPEKRLLPEQLLERICKFSYLLVGKMETHVLIPHPLILKVRPSANCSSPSVAKLLEQQVSVTTTVEIPKGWQIHPAQGTLRCGKLEVYSTINDNNVSTTFGERSELRIVFIKTKKFT